MTEIELISRKKSLIPIKIDYFYLQSMKLQP